jgi:hypothetical protein
MYSRTTPASIADFQRVLRALGLGQERPVLREYGQVAYRLLKRSGFRPERLALAPLPSVWLDASPVSGPAHLIVYRNDRPWIIVVVEEAETSWTVVVGEYDRGEAEASGAADDSGPEGRVVRRAA